MKDVGIVVATYGDAKWRAVAYRALGSVSNQTAIDKCDIARVHGDSLHEARNAGAEQVDAERLIFLDADDELHPEYVEKMLEADGDIRRPATLGVVDGRPDDYAVMIPERNIFESNYIVIGAMCEKDAFMDVGGFEDYPALEDWDLWLKLIRNGASVVEVPEAIYMVHVSQNSRNANIKAHHDAYRRIKKKHNVH